ncbi:hypothetical protein PVAND_014384 [Polypedilum vanderplanki]|uniref:Uncharacterized protein n=1 Tax=Polypedilum vanderplanki TaxID=319348 RepID=A0A9J6B9P6_POLVA|nr:hypothetical protein PVAND_014384 [Polypedilum vanderplanki]
MQLQLERIADGSYKLPSKLLKIMKEKCKKFLTSEAFCAALVLDPRFSWNTSNEFLMNQFVIKHEETLSSSLDFSTSGQIYDEDVGLQEFLGGGSRVEYGSRVIDIKNQIMKLIYSEAR